MLVRRAFLATVAALPLAGRFISADPRHPSDNHVMFWFYFRSAVTPARAMSIERARKAAIADMRFETTSEREALQVLERAADGILGLRDMPQHWREYFDKLERESYPRNQARRDQPAVTQPPTTMSERRTE